MYYKELSAYRKSSRPKKEEKAILSSFERYRLFTLSFSLSPEVKELYERYFKTISLFSRICIEGLDTHGGTPLFLCKWF